MGSGYNFEFGSGSTQIRNFQSMFKIKFFIQKFDYISYLIVTKKFKIN